MHVSKALNVKEIYVVAFSYGGIIVLNMIRDIGLEFMNRVKKICFIDSVHDINKHLGDDKMFEHGLEFIARVGTHFRVSNTPTGSILPYRTRDGCSSLSVLYTYDANLV
eukprot:TRINITY_DN5738_c0_g1_i2.p2 TRINITY_DN5738_c0_g1~~TRINITY_DN5738_c0_g1_i2.p2  ORF type:complete len:109 (+),score=9.79 TRINITY_DN5738_c0_g1_i2:539-865(+)